VCSILTRLELDWIRSRFVLEISIGNERVDGLDRGVRLEESDLAGVGLVR
jgi:hypothetical protein